MGYVDTRTCHTVQCVRCNTETMNSFPMAHSSQPTVHLPRIPTVKFKKNADKSSRRKLKRRSAHSVRSTKNARLLTIYASGTLEDIMKAFARMKRKPKKHKKINTRTKAIPNTCMHKYTTTNTSLYIMYKLYNNYRFKNGTLTRLKPKMFFNLN